MGRLMAVRVTATSYRAPRGYPWERPTPRAAAGPLTRRGGVRRDETPTEDPSVMEINVRAKKMTFP